MSTVGGWGVIPQMALGGYSPISAWEIASAEVGKPELWLESVGEKATLARGPLPLNGPH
jgi:hypothetical protein